MAMISQRPRRTREFTGPSPHSVAILARPPNRRPADYLIMERRKKEQMLSDAESQTKYQKICDLKNDWEKLTDRKIKLNTVKRRVEGYMQNQEFTVEDRRERLRELLSSEEEKYLREMEEKEETTIERQAKMRERAKFLREKREAERLEVVQEKLDQLFRDQCEELRSTLSKRQQDEVCAERLDQIRQKEEQQLEKAAEEAMFAKLWYQDMAEKEAREERETLAQMERNRSGLHILQKQIAALEQKKADAKALKMEEAALLKEQAALRKLEEQKMFEEKLIRQQETRNMLDHSLQLKLKKKAREQQEQLAFDMKILQQLLEESKNEALEQAQRKKELREEDRKYRDYLHKLMEEEKQREKELEKMVNEEVERMWQKRLDQWAQERKARKQLLDQVMEVRRGQIQERLRQNEIRQIDAERERIEINKVIEENKRLDEEERRKRHDQNQRHQEDLSSQMLYQRGLKAEEKARDEEEYRMGVQAEMEFQRKIKEAMDTAHVVKQHPMRRALLSQLQHI